MRKAITTAMETGNQPPSKILVEVEAKKTRSMKRKTPLTG